ncbi:MAG: hypothetical protein Ct9H90mP2_12520 [Dehalococcoidia bacterium]|nr:MAG: hypothetical protein Ct9H90mP2_12520 [Dehalococcoidia bacterium]
MSMKKRKTFNCRWSCYGFLEHGFSIPERLNSNNIDTRGAYGFYKQH